MEVTGHQAISVREMSQAGQARRTAVVLAERLGFDPEQSGRLGLVVTEAATNLVKHAQGGEIVLGPSREEEARGVEVLAMDRGPGIRDLDRAFGDGYSTSGSMGSGLGAIRRNASLFDLYSSESGTILFARVGTHPGHGADAPDRHAGKELFEVGAVCVPCPGETVSGDAWAIARTVGRIHVLLADGLGHGQDAHVASSLAAQIFSENASDEPVELIRRLHDALRPTRGAAAAVLELNLAERTACLAGIGNISAVILADGTQRSMVSHHGVLGHSTHRVHEFVYPWPPRALVVLHSDGIGTHWDLARYPGLMRRHPTLIAAALYRDFHRQRDDATVVALRESA
ncbi:MAG: SpoIIE family protein phosphatase [Bacteroidota bacterium]